MAMVRSSVDKVIPSRMINPGLRKAVIVLPVAWTGAWLTYYGMCLLLKSCTQVQPTPTHFDDRTFVNGTRVFRQLCKVYQAVDRMSML